MHESLGQRALRVAADLEQTTSDDRALAAVTARIAAARPIFQTDPAGLSTLVFAGDPDRISFVTEFADGPAGGGLYLANFALDPSNSKLVLSLTPYPTRSKAVPARHIQLHPSQALSLRYFGLDADTGTRVWQSTWRNMNKLPEMIELSIRKTSDAPATATSIVALRLARN